MEENNKLAVVEETKSLMTNEVENSFYSVKADTKEEKVALFNSINNPDYRIADFINKQIDVKDVLVEMVELTNETTGEITTAPRIILVDVKGKSYQCVSVGVFSALKKMMMLFGEPTWNDGLKVEVKQVSKKERKMLTLELV